MCTKLEYEKKHQKWTQTNNLLKKNDKMDKLINNSWKSQKKNQLKMPTPLPLE